MIRTSENVQVRLELRISFQVFQPELYVVKPIDFHSQIRYYIQNEMLDAYAKVTFRDFLRTYAGIVWFFYIITICCNNYWCVIDISIAATEKSHAFFGEYGLKVIDVQV